MIDFQKARLIGPTIHRIKRDESNEGISFLIREFLVQVANEPIVISANGFFNIDYRLLGAVRMKCAKFPIVLNTLYDLFCSDFSIRFYQMVAASTTYLIILIQFEQARNKNG